MARRILITGGAGFIGSRLVKALMRRAPDTRIWVIDNLHAQVHGRDATPPAFPESTTFVRGDVDDRRTLADLVAHARPTVIYHLAAETGTGQSYDEPSRYCGVNVMGTANLIEAIRSTGGVERVVLAASRAVYGEGAYTDATGREFVGLPRDPAKMENGDFTVGLPAPARAPWAPAPSRAGLPPAPSSIYASTKLMQEYLLTQAGDSADWRAVMLRFQNVYGPGQSLRNPYTGVLSIFATQLLAGKHLAIFEDGQIARDFVFVDDVVASLVLAAERDVAHGTTLDIGSGEAVTIVEVARILMKALGIEHDAYEITGQFRVGDIRHARADIEAARAVLGWCPEVPIEKGLASLAAWAKDEYGQIARGGNDGR
jgi:dTDP-L-rhamnose 4-epimerase